MKYIFNKKIVYLTTLTISVLSLLTAVHIEYSIELNLAHFAFIKNSILIDNFHIFFSCNYSENLFWIKLQTLIFFISFLLSGYHFGIETGFFEEFAGCTAQNVGLLDNQKYLKVFKIIQLAAKMCFKILEGLL